MIRRLTRTLAATAVVAGAVLHAQNQTPVFRGGVELVTLDVIVVDRNGDPVPGLTADDFKVTLGGQIRPVRVLDYLAFGSRSGSAVSARETTNAAADAGRASRGGRVIVLMFDDLSYRPGEGRTPVTALERLLDTFDADDLVGVVTTSGLGPVLEPTRDRAQLSAILHDKRLVGRNDNSTAPFYITVDEAYRIESEIRPVTLSAVAGRECPLVGLPTDVCTSSVAALAGMLVQDARHRAAEQLAAYQHAMAALGRGPSPRVLVVLSNGVGASPRDTELPVQLDIVSHAAAEAAVQVYALTETADYATAADVTEKRAEARRQEAVFLDDGMRAVTAATGGESFHVTGTADRFFRRIEAETSAMYRLGVEAPLQSGKQHFFATKVTVDRPGVTVRVNRNAMLASAAPDVTPVEDRLRLALAQGGVSYGVPVAVAAALRRDPKSLAKLELDVNVRVPAAATGPLVAMFGVVDDAGKIVQAGRTTVPRATAPADYELAFPVELDPGRYRLRVVVADGNGAIGGIERSVKGELARLGDYVVSDLLPAWTGPDGQLRFLGLETLPEAATTLLPSLELYADGPDAPVATVRFALVPLGAERPVAEGTVTPPDVAGVRTARVPLPIADLPAGAYTLVATVLQGGAAVGTLSVPVRKAGEK